jgi:hypothetical protein
MMMIGGSNYNYNYDDRRQWEIIIASMAEIEIASISENYNCWYFGK